jgi:hypothetical protein
MKVGVMPAQVRLGAQPSSVLTNLPSPSPSLSRPQLFLPLAALLVAGAPTAISAGDSGECSPPSVATLRRFIGANGVGDNFTAIAGKACNTTTTIGAVCDYEGVEPDGKLSGAKLRCEYQYTKHYEGSGSFVVTTQGPTGGTKHYQNGSWVVTTHTDWALDGSGGGYWQWYVSS